MTQVVSDNIVVTPGELTDICGIPAAITENHHENFYFWQRFNIIDATLLHVDAHSDMFGPAPLFAEIPEDYYQYLDISTFICPAFHYGIVSSIYWNNPHSRFGFRFKDLGCRDGKERRKLETYTERDNIFWAKDEDFHVSQCSRLAVMPQKMKLESGFILDIDLDAFCCSSGKSHYSEEPERISGYERRIKETCRILRNSEKPGLITITRSQGTGLGIMGRYVPPELVDDVQKKTIQSLTEAYSA